MEAADLLFEIGVEELPARFCAPALAQIQEKAQLALEQARLDHGELSTLGTPRRLTLLVRDVALRQADRTVLVKGPAASVAFDAAGKPTRAAEGFARGQDIAVDELVVEADDRGASYVYARRHEPSRAAIDLLPDLLRDLVLGLDFPKSMRWGAGQLRFGRPIRWLLALLGDQPVGVTVGDVISGTTTRGHRTLGPAEPFPVSNSREYVATCELAGVMVEPSRRRETIWQQVQTIAASLNGRVPYNEDLLDEVTWLVEQPYAFTGGFDSAFLDLPAEVLVTSMREHQRYFPVFAKDGDDLLPFFIAVSNGQMDHISNVRHGNEKVLRARLADARFFWDEDRRRPLAERLDALESIVFQQALGSQFARTERIVHLARDVAEALGFDPAMKQRVERTALLCKCDLPTLMVGEFPELQGVMGRAYARVDGEDPLVAMGLYEHYLPRGAGDELPRSPTGIAVGLADRLDMLAGFFGLGLIPTGSADPFALRRTALGMVRIVMEGGLTLSLGSLLDAALSGHAQVNAAAARHSLRDFFATRLEVHLRERGLRYDVVDAVLAAGFDDLADTLKRAEALSRAVATPAFAAVSESFKRVANISARADETAQPTETGTPMPDPHVPAEVSLWSAFTEARGDAESALSARDYDRFYETIARLKQPVDAFFDGVLVMDPDPTVRRRRLGMLQDIAGLLTRPADLRRLALG